MIALFGVSRLCVFVSFFFLFLFFFFFNDTATTEIYTLSLHDALPIFSRFGSAPLFLMPISCWGSAHAFYTYQFLLQQHPCFFYCPFLVAAAPHFFYCPFLVAAAPRLFILPFSRCGSAPAFYTAHFSLRQHLRFLYRSEERRVGKRV